VPASTALPETLAGAASQVYLLAMALVNPKNPTRPLCLSDIRAMIARGEADIDAGRVSDLDELLAEWEAEDEAERRARVRGKPSAAKSLRLRPGRISPTCGSITGVSADLKRSPTSPGLFGTRGG
jgi:hypothetical protein